MDIKFVKKGSCVGFLIWITVLPVRSIKQWQVLACQGSSALLNSSPWSYSLRTFGGTLIGTLVAYGG